MAENESESDRELYLETRLEVPREHADAVCDFIVENITNGLVLEEEEESPTTGIIFYVAHERAAVVDRLNDYLASLASSVKLPAPELRQRPIEGVEWVEQYRKSIKPIRIGDDIVVRPSWIEAQAAALDIMIEPKMAFGTGTHETTRSSMLAIREHFREGMTLLDMGCGSGILSILADHLGASKIKAVDFDPVAVENSLENFALNNVRAEREVVLGSIEDCNYDQPFDFVCANIIRSTILEMMDRLIALTKPGGVLVLSGLLEQDEEQIEAALNERGQTDFTILEDNDWRTYTVTTKQIAK
ncbi:50S ribosomal protein L11 methyltransferase [candidate division GN15 bacterium]|nr:50S ribosomal protein L11 methyltransferase [candidate division GN15 bacterium]